MKIPALINQFDIERLKQSVSSAEPFPFFQIDNFLSEEFANSVLASYPSYGDALKKGRSFSAVNEKGKVQLTDSATFSPAIKELNAVLADPDWLEVLTLWEFRNYFQMTSLLVEASTKPVHGGIWMSI